MLNDFRKDYLLNRWVVIATHRKRRPTDFIKRGETDNSNNQLACPFCPGNERKTPPATLVFKKKNNRIAKDKDTNGTRHKNWLIRVVPNLYSAFSPPLKKDKTKMVKAIGHHEVLIESPVHNEHPADSRISQLTHVLNGYIERLKTLSSLPYVRYVSIFRNHGLNAGASLSHAHSQIIATPIIPPILANELSSSKKYYDKHGKCLFCDLLNKEKNSSRLFWQNENFVALSPWAGIHPFEFWIFPKKHQATLVNLRRKTIRDLAKAIKSCLNGLKLLLNDPPYNYGFHLAPNKEVEKYYHWHLEIYPKLSIWAGFEKSTGIYINVVPPEDAGKNLKEKIEDF